MKLFIPGGAGYIGAWMVPHLLADGHEVTVFDMQWFGNPHLPSNDRMRIIRGDVRDVDTFSKAAEGHDTCIYLACISNNEMCERDPDLHDAVNRDAFPPAIEACRAAGIKRFIYASSVAAYGSSEKNAPETQKLEPSTLYGWAKQHCEHWTLANQAKDFTTVILRSASVCGYSPHQRFDLTINRMTHDAIRKGKITVNGGAQRRCHIHMKDITSVYKLLLAAPDNLIAGQTFNAVSDNLTVRGAARIVANVIGGVEVCIKPYTDDRSYTVDGSKFRDTFNWKPQFGVMDAAYDLKVRFQSGMWKDSATNPEYMNMAAALV